MDSINLPENEAMTDLARLARVVGEGGRPLHDEGCLFGLLVLEENPERRRLLFRLISNELGEEQSGWRASTTQTLSHRLDESGGVGAEIISPIPEITSPPCAGAP